MTDWLQRAKAQLEIKPMTHFRPLPQFLKSTGGDTPKTTERCLTPVLTVPQPGQSQDFEAPEMSKGSTPPPAFQENHIPPRAVPPLSTEEEAWLRAWLDHIDETEAEGIAVLMNKCRVDMDARRYFLKRARGEICLVNPKMDAYFSDAISERKTKQE
jgi:hypothetical protein